MKRRPSASVAARNEALVERLRELKGDHPFWGYRHCWAHLRYVDRLEVNEKRVYRLMKVHGLLASQSTPVVPRVSTRPKPKPDRPNQWWGIDMTKAMTDAGWAYVVLVKDWYTKKIVGHYSGPKATAGDWLEALDRGLNRQFPDGVRDHELHLMSDNGSQPTSLRFMKACGMLGVRQAFTSYNNPKGNADTERVMRTLKEELIWLREWRDAHELSAAIDKWVEIYNSTWLHMALGYRTPNQAEENYNLSHMTLLENAC
jgi:transposase InsO family protein